MRFGRWLALLAAYGLALLGDGALGARAHRDRSAGRDLTGEAKMAATRGLSDADEGRGDRGPGQDGRGDIGRDRVDVAGGIKGYPIGLGLALALTGISFYTASGGGLVWKPTIPIALVVLAIAQIGVHLVFLLHLTTAPDNTSNVMALAFGTLIVFLVLAGSLWIMQHLNANMMPSHLMHMQR